MENDVFVLNAPIRQCLTRNCASRPGGCTCGDSAPVISQRSAGPVRQPTNNGQDLLPLPSIEDLIGNEKAEGSNADRAEGEIGWVPPWQRPQPEDSDIGYPWGVQRPTSTMGTDGLIQNVTRLRRVVDGPTTNARRDGSDILPLPAAPDWGEIAALPSRK